jgi:hypothetical protein
MATSRSKPIWGSYCAAFFVICDNKKAGNKIPAFLFETPIEY